MALDSSLGQGRNWKSLPEESHSHKWAGSAAARGRRRGARRPLCVTGLFAPLS